MSAPDDPRVVHVEPRVVGGSLDADAAARAESEAASAAAADVETGAAVVDRSASVCPYLRRLDESGALGEPADGVDPMHRCDAVADPAPLSNRQQTLLCLTSAHRDCPRYVSAEVSVPVAPVGATTHVPKATVAASLVLAASAAVAFGFVVANGGITVPTAQAAPSPSTPAVPSPSLVAVVSPSPAASPSARPSPRASSSVQPSPSPASPSVEPSRSPSPEPSPAASPSARPTPTSDRYELLEPCPDRPDCWIYTVRAGDNLFSIANYFGVPLDTVYALNPWVRTAGIRAGRELILPPPTR